MGEVFLKLKLSFLIITVLLISNVQAMNVIVAKEHIKYKEKISVTKLVFRSVEQIRKKCDPITLKYLEGKKLIAAHHINKGTIICKDNLTTYQKKSVLFNFGAIQIEKNAKVINENDEYIMIKNENGKKDKIYKDGRIK